MEALPTSKYLQTSSYISNDDISALISRSSVIWNALPPPSHEIGRAQVSYQSCIILDSPIKMFQFLKESSNWVKPPASKTSVIPTNNKNLVKINKKSSKQYC